MSMHEALRSLGSKLSWATRPDDQPQQTPVSLTVVEEMEILVRLAGSQGAIERASSTWQAVCCWAATELLETFVKQEGADDAKAAGLRARARVLRELLALEDKREAPRFEDLGPHIP